jgi:hypothetical protein
MARLVSLLFWLISVTGAFAQYGNDWIRFNQQYFKISTAKEGIYRLTYADLQVAGFPVGSDSRRIQLFHRGIEQAIRIQKANSGVTQLEPGDYIEFYGQRNTGITDAELYQPANAQPHQLYNLYSDTTAYFLTISPFIEFGKRMEVTDEINIATPKELYHNNEKTLLLTTQHSEGKRYNDYIQNSFFEEGEGWTGDEIRENQFIDYTITDLVNGVTGSGQPVLELMCVGRANVSHQVEISVGPTSPSRIVASEFFSEYNAKVITTTLNWSDIGADGRLVVRVRALGVSGANDRLSASYIKVNFPQNFNAANADKFFWLAPNPSNKSYIEIQNAPVGARLFDLTNPSNVKYLLTTGTSTINSLIPGSAVPRKLFLNSTFITPHIKPVTFRNINAAQHNYIIVSHPMLMKPTAEYADPVKAYAAYRASHQGGGYDTLVVTTQQLYDQFNYGEISPLAIRRFMSYMVANGSPNYLFLVGKGLDWWLGYHRNPNNVFPFHDLVPSYGYPASDALYTAGLAGTTVEPAVPTGRVTALNPQNVASYLNKVKEMEAQPFNELWRKELLHLSGGINSGEPALFQSYLQGFQAIAEDVYLGGKAFAISKNNTAIQFINISDKINSGVNLVTLFGHSSPSQNDFNIGFVSATELGYNNPGKYPVFLINGCNAGDFFQRATRYGEDWINTPNKGAIGFMANTSFGFSNVLRKYSDTFYSVAYGDSEFINSGLGDVLKEVSRRIAASGFTAIVYNTQSQQMMLLGDPAIKLFGAGKPDYEVHDASVFAESFSTEPITALSDSFAIKIAVRNFGIAKTDSVLVRVRRTFTDNTFVEYDSLFPPVLYRDTLVFRIYRDREKGFGNNSFLVTIDANNTVSELNEENNTAGRTIFIPLNSSRNLFPQNFSVVSSTSLNLVVQSTDVLSDARDYIIQVDTVDSFDSPFFKEFVVNGTLASQNVTLLTTDTTAYYWRSKFQVPLPGESMDWITSSFTYINNGPEGWAQVHFPQYLSNEAVGLVKDEDARLLRLEETITDVSITTFGSANGTPFTAVSVKVNNTEFNPESLGTSCRNNTINLVAFNRTTTFPYVSIPVQYPDPRACGRRPEIIASFLSGETETGDGKDLIQYVNNVPVGDSVVLFSIGDPSVASWSGAVLSKLGELGISSAQIASLQPGEPFVIYARKGASVGSARIDKSSGSPPQEQMLVSDATVTGRYTSGVLKSTLIGPAQAWEQVIVKVDVSELPQTDQFSVDILGITLTGDIDTLRVGIISFEDISSIDAVQYPYLRLIYHATDDVNLTAPQLNKWLVVYTPTAEGVLSFNGTTNLQTIQEGELWTGSFSFTNISTKSFSDSLVVRQELFNKAARGSSVDMKKIHAPLPGAKTDFNVAVKSAGKAGLNDLDVYVNPRIQPELYYENNILQLNNYIQVIPDLMNPVLRVTIDGRLVTNGDFVSANPNIEITIWDENPFLLRNDTVGIKMYMRFPCESEPCAFKEIYFSRNDVAWKSGSENTFVVNFTPTNLANGMYVLRVEARDVVGNLSGDEPYEVRFVVRNVSFTEIQRPYPNPASELVHFTAIINQDELPEFMRIQIIDSNGKLINEIGANAFFVGTNDWIWNGTDANGTSLPGGLYFYRFMLIGDNKIIASQQGKLMLVR